MPYIGKQQPRLFTPPLRRLTSRTSLGYDAIRFATDVLCLQLLPWQKWWLIHALELDEHGMFRFRIILTLVARQNGKTFLLKVLTLYFMYRGRARLILGAAQDVRTAREAWQDAITIVRADPELAEEIDFIRTANGQQEFRLSSGVRYLITATNAGAGRGLSVDLLIMDELRMQRDWLAWGALSKTTMARPNSLTIGISNAGEDDSVVLNSLRERALAAVDPAIGIMEWSAPDGCDTADIKAWAAANPAMGHPQGISLDAIRAFHASDPPQVFRTEVLCQHVEVLDAAIDPAAWADCRDASGTLEHRRRRIGACVDVAPDGGHVTLAAAAALEDGKVRVEIVQSWKSTDDARFELGDAIAKIAPRAIAWFPSGPAAALATVLRPPEPRNDRGAGGKTKRPWETVEYKGGGVAEVCQGFADLVRGRRIVQPGDPLLDAHVAGAKRFDVGEGWRFVRRGVGHVDAAYAAAGAVHVVLSLPAEKPKQRMWVV